ncbi:O-antigen ligase family protein [Candidatus Kaiserbacteria bacterium]|nr:O-antigen ligase family protein [Candidatus Kaiserbacteria bacterium]
MKTDDILRWSIVGGILLIFLIPLFVANSLFFPFITGKAFAFRILVEIVFALWAILAVRDPSVRPKKSFLLYVISAFLVSLLISVLLAVNPDKAFWSNFERMEGWIGIAHLALYFAVVFSVFNTEKFWKILWNTTIAVSVIEACYGLLQLAGVITINQGGVRVDGTFGNATYLAVYMLFHVFITALAWMWWGRGKEFASRALAFWYGLAIVFQLVMIFYSATRGAILGLIGGCAIAGLSFLIFGKENAALRKWGTGAVIALLILGGGFFAVKDTPFVQHNEVLSRLAGIAGVHNLFSELSTRSEIWSIAWKGFLERPVFGWGQEGFNYVFDKHYQATLYAQEPWFDRAHNEFLDWLVAGGAVAFLLYLSFFALALWYLWRKGTVFSLGERGIFTGLLGAYLLNNLVVFDNLFSYILFFTVLAYLAYRSSAALPTLFAKPIAENARIIFPPLIAVVMAFVLYFVNVPGITTASYIIQGLSPHQEGISTNFDYFKKSVASAEGEGLGLQEVREQLAQFAIQVKGLNAGDQAFQASVEQYAADQLALQAALTPKDTRVVLLYGSYLAQVGTIDGARTVLLAAHDLSPQKQEILINLGDLEASVGNYPAALSWLKQAYDLEPAYDWVRSSYAGIAIRAGQRSLAESLLLPRYGTMTPDDSDLLSSYLAAKDFQSVFAILRGRIEKNPNDYQAHVNLGATYLQSGDSADAIAELQKAMQLNPSFQAQGQSYIDQIRAGKTL